VLWRSGDYGRCERWAWRDQILGWLELGEEQARLTDLPALVRLEQLLEGEPTERFEHSVEVIVAGVIAAVQTALTAAELDRSVWHSGSASSSSP
jgi:hypothetical protein